VRVLRTGTNRCNGMTLDAELNLLLCEHDSSSLVRERPDGTREVLAATFGGRELNSPNDVIVARDGSIYFTDPSFGRWEAFGVPRAQELSFQGVYRFSPARAELQLAVENCAQPNGLCLAPDGTTLYVSDSARAHIRIFHVARNGELSGRGCLARRIGEGRIENGVLDGIKCDERGNVYAAGPRGVWIFAPNGDRLGLIPVPEPVANLTWGGEGRRTLLFTASTSLYSLAMNVAGAPADWEHR
jgi:gluconolactonase